MKSRAPSAGQAFRSVPVRVLPAEDAEKVEVVLCMRDTPETPPFPLPTQFGHCALCGYPIYWSLTVPTRAKKMCLECYGSTAPERKEAP